MSLRKDATPWWGGTGWEISLRNIVPIDTFKLMYNAIVLPHFKYAGVVYDAASETNKSKLQRLQTRAAQQISGTSPRDSTT